jgi:hypothetical protein
MKALEILRHQFAGHAMGRWAGNDKPGRLVPAKLLGQALRETGLTELPEFARRLREDVASKLEGRTPYRPCLLRFIAGCLEHFFLPLVHPIWRG